MYNKERKENGLNGFSENEIHYLLQSAKTIIVLFGPFERERSDLLEQLSNSLEKFTKYKVDGPDAAFMFTADQPLLIENFDQLNFQTRKFIVSLEVPLVVTSTKPFFRELKSLQRNIVRFKVHKDKGISQRKKRFPGILGHFGKNIAGMIQYPAKNGLEPLKNELDDPGIPLLPIIPPAF